MVDEQPVPIEHAEDEENPDPPPVIEHGPKLPHDIAIECLEGKWGVGQDRRDNLHAAGYDYKDIRAETIKILNPPK